MVGVPPLIHTCLEIAEREELTIARNRTGQDKRNDPNTYQRLKMKAGQTQCVSSGQRRWLAIPGNHTKQLMQGWGRCHVGGVGWSERIVGDIQPTASTFPTRWSKLSLQFVLWRRRVPAPFEKHADTPRATAGGYQARQVIDVADQMPDALINRSLW